MRTNLGNNWVTNSQQKLMGVIMMGKNLIIPQITNKRRKTDKVKSKLLRPKGLRIMATI
jgi:hypothetical protein